MKKIQFKIRLDRKSDRYIIKIYHDKKLVGINFYHGIGAVEESDDIIDSKYLENDEDLMRVYQNVLSLAKEGQKIEKIENKAIEIYLTYKNNL